MSDLMLAFYGDDFTGSTDAMESLTLNGAPTALFLEPPTPDLLRQIANLRAVGVAGISRSMTPKQMDAALPLIFRALKKLNAPLVHYKVCSTFDSAPHIGSIGRATEIGISVFEPDFVPLMVGAPALKRYVAFGNLFATVNGVTHRLDRHPTMSKHPITPMDESDIRLHLDRQTKLPIGLIDVLQLAQPRAVIEKRLRELVMEGAKIVLFDTIDQEHLATIGGIIDAQKGEQPLFLVGSSGIEYALTAYWLEAGLIEKPSIPSAVEAAEQLVVMSGSAEPITAAQIQWALSMGFCGIRLNAERLIDPAGAESERNAAVREALEALRQGESVVLYSTLGADDPAIEQTRRRIHALGFEPASLGERLGREQGRILRRILDEHDIQRVCVIGGDTCGYVSQELGIYALDVLIPVAPGSPLCRAYSHEARYDGLEISLKSGKTGNNRYLESILKGVVLE